MDSKTWSKRPMFWQKTSPSDCPKCESPSWRKGFDDVKGEKVQRWQCSSGACGMVYREKLQHDFRQDSSRFIDKGYHLVDDGRET